MPFYSLFREAKLQRRRNHHFIVISRCSAYHHHIYHRHYNIVYIKSRLILEPLESNCSINPPHLLINVYIRNKLRVHHT